MARKNVWRTMLTWVKLATYWVRYHSSELLRRRAFLKPVKSEIAANTQIDWSEFSKFEPPWKLKLVKIEIAANRLRLIWILIVRTYTKIHIFDVPHFLNQCKFFRSLMFRHIFHYIFHCVPIPFSNKELYRSFMNHRQKFCVQIKELSV